MTKHRKRMNYKELGVFAKLGQPELSKHSLVKVIDGRYKEGFYTAEVHEQMKVAGKNEIFITKWDRKKCKWIYTWVLACKVFPEEVDLESV